VKFVSKNIFRQGCVAAQPKYHGGAAATALPIIRRSRGDDLPRPAATGACTAGKIRVKNSFPKPATRWLPKCAVRLSNTKAPDTKFRYFSLQMRYEFVEFVRNFLIKINFRPIFMCIFVF